MDHAQRMQKLSEQQAALRQGDEAAVAAHRAAGKLTARDRVSQLLDAGTFVEMEVYATQGHVVTGYGLINSRPAYVIAQDVTQQGGAISLTQARKISKTLTLAQTSGAPVIVMPDSKGMLVQEGAELLAAYAQVLGELAGLRGTCPVIALLAGEAVGIAAHFVQVAGIAIAVDNGSLAAPFAPSVMRAVHGDKLTDAQLGGAEALATKGIVALRADSEAQGLSLVRALVDLLPTTMGERVPLLEGDDLNRLISADSGELARDIADAGTSVELYANWGNACRTYLARVGGYACGIVSCAGEDGGRLDAFSCDKVAKLVQLCNDYNLPVITLVDSEGLALPGPEGQAWLMTASTRMLMAYARTLSPKVAVMTGNAVGPAYVAFAGKGMADISFAWPGAYIAPLTAEATVQTLEAERLQQQDRATLVQEAADAADAFAAAKAGLVDNVIDPAETRKHIIAALELLWAKG